MSKQNLNEHTKRLLATKSGKKAKAKMQTAKTPSRQEPEEMDSSESQPANKGKATTKPRTQMKATITKSSTHNAQPEPDRDDGAGLDLVTGSEAVVEATPAEVGKVDEAVQAAIAIDEKPATTTKTKTKSTKPAARSKPKAALIDTNDPLAKGPSRLSALDAAFIILCETEREMTAGELIDTMAEAKLWVSTSGKTPANTLHAAISTEIKKKGLQSRFAKGERGKFVRKS